VDIRRDRHLHTALIDHNIDETLKCTECRQRVVPYWDLRSLHRAAL